MTCLKSVGQVILVELFSHKDLRQDTVFYKKTSMFHGTLYWFWDKVSNTITICILMFNMVLCKIVRLQNY